jgi:hypothetical protein
MNKSDPIYKSAPITGPTLWVEIVLKESLEPHWWVWFGDLALEALPSGQAFLSGALRDQAALAGILERIRDLNLQIATVQVQDHPYEKDISTGLPTSSTVHRS